MAKKIPNIAFVTKAGMHNKNLGNFAKDVGLETLKQVMNDREVNLEGKFETVSKTLRILDLVNKGMVFLNGNNAGSTPNSNNPLVNNESDQIPYLSNSDSNKLALTSLYLKINTHIGYKTRGRLKRIENNGPFIERVNKVTSSSEDDYQSSTKRKQLTLKSGFNQKLFTFFLEDTYFSCKDYYELFEIKRRFQTELKKNKSGKKEIYGGALKTKHQLKFKNRMDYYTCHIQIHLIKIIDDETDVRSLIREITTNQESLEFSDNGKIPRDFQLSDPDLNEKNKISSSFSTLLNCKLNDSSKFQERCRIVKSWSRSLNPGSILEFNLTHHLGKGINLNRILDMVEESNDKNDISYIDTFLDEIENQKNLRSSKKGITELKKKLLNKFANKNILEHPTGYIFVSEIVGDRRASITNKQGDYFSGYSPIFTSYEFKTQITYLEEDQNEEAFVFKRSKKEQNFKEGSIFEEIFYPDRENKFQVNFHDIQFPGTINKKANWILENNPITKGTIDSTNNLETFVNLLDKMGLDMKDINTDGSDVNFSKEGASEATNQPTPLETETGEE